MFPPEKDLQSVDIILEGQLRAPYRRLDSPMSSKLCSLIVITLLCASSLVQADSPGFDTAVGTVDKIDKHSVTITLSDKSKKSIEFKITGTSNFSLFAPQVRSDKTIITQRKAEATDLTKGQFVAIIYAEADKEYVVLSAVMKPMDKATEKSSEKK